MANFNKKKRYSFWHSPIALTAFFCIVVLFAYNMIGLIGKERETDKNKVGEQNKLDELNKRKETLSGDIKKLNTQEGVEESLRDKFQVVKPGEKMVVIVDEENNEATENTVKMDHSFWGYVKRLFGK